MDWSDQASDLIELAEESAMGFKPTEDWGSSTKVGPGPVFPKGSGLMLARGAVYACFALSFVLWTLGIVAWAATGVFPDNFEVVCTALVVGFSTTATVASMKKSKVDKPKRDPLLSYAEFLKPSDLEYFTRWSAPTVADEWQRAVVASEPEHIKAARKHKESLAKKGKPSEKPTPKGMKNPPPRKPPKGGSGQSRGIVGSLEDTKRGINEARKEIEEQIRVREAWIEEAKGSYDDFSLFAIEDTPVGRRIGKYEAQNELDRAAIASAALDNQAKINMARNTARTRASENLAREMRDYNGNVIGRIGGDNDVVIEKTAFIQPMDENAPIELAGRQIRDIQRKLNEAINADPDVPALHDGPSMTAPVPVEYE